MKRTSWIYRRGKNNPEGICRTCKSKIFNRSKSSLFCKECSEAIDLPRNRVGSIKSDFKKRYPDYELKVSFEVNKKQVEEAKDETNKI